MASLNNDILIRKFEINEIKKNRNLIHFKVIYNQYKQNLLESNETIIIWKELKDFERLYQEICKLRIALYIKDDVPYFPIKESKLFKRELNEDEIEERKKSSLNLLEFISKHQCFYKHKLFIKFFEESEFKIDKIIYSKDDLFKKLTDNNNSILNNDPFNSVNSKQQDNKQVNQQDNQQDNQFNFPIPFQQLNNQSNLDKKFNNLDKSINKDLETTESNDTYLIDAAHLLCQGSSNEERQEYESAFESYKCAISILLKGVKTEKDRTKKLNVKKKVEKYLNRAEEICKNYLMKDEKDGNRRFSLDTPYKQIMNDEFCSDKNSLSKFKLLSFSNKVQIVYDVQLNEKFAIKIVHKVPNLDGLKRFFIFPKHSLNMVQLYQIFQNDYAYYLILEYLNCTKLSDILDQLRTRLNPCVECLILDPIDKAEELENNEFNDIDIINLDDEEILFDKERFKDDEDYYLNRCDSIPNIKTLSEIEDDLLNYQNSNRKSKLSNSKSEQKLSNLVHSKSTDFNQNSNQSNKKLIKTSNNETKSTFNTLTGIFDRAKNLIKNVDNTIRNSAINQARLSIDNLDLKLNLNNYILERINDKLMNINYICDQHLNQQLNECEIGGKMLFTEDIIKKWLYQILIALDNLHNQGILYMNLDPTNILIHSDLENVSIAYKYSLDYEKISMNLNLDLSNISQLIVSSFYSNYSSDSFSYYIAPELFIYGSEITSAVDWWSFGVIAFELLTSKPLCSMIPSINCKNLIQFPSFVSLEARDLIEKLLIINPKERLKCTEIKIHPFFKQL